MPTGYTSEIYNGKEVSGKDFLLQCARAFGACIMMRDEPNNAEIPEEFKPDTYHLDQIEKAKDDLKKYQSMSNEEIQKKIDKEYDDKIKYNQKQIEEARKMKNRYLNTIAEVTAWIPPTPDHVNLKQFALQQLRESIDWDCGTKYYEEEVIKLSPKEWLDNRIESCLKSIEYHTKEYDSEVKRVSERNKWIKDLRESLK
jgi:hypothetical protein